MHRELRHVFVWLQKHFIAIEFVTWAIALAALAYSGMQYYSLSQEYAALKSELASTTSTYRQVTTNWREKFAAVVSRNDTLATTLSVEQQKNSEFQNQITGVQGQVELLKKLAETDKELLQKYSKVYFLSENYEPATTTLLASKYLLETKSEQRFHASAQPFLTRMIDDAATAGVQLKIASAYRSFGYQSSLKADYKTTYGSGANAFSADQGYSEHQLGTTLDFTTTKIGESFANTTKGFDGSDGYKWLVENAYKYGFVLSYPKGNGYYVYEPWHWRFIGVALAARLHNENKNFYDLDQREIDGYLALIFN